MSHARRDVQPRHPLHVTLRMQRHVWKLRSRRCYGVIEKAFYACCQRHGTRIVQFSVQHNHIHLIVESVETGKLGRVMQALSIRIARGLNRAMDRSGGVFADRYHSRSLRSPKETRAAIVYVLQNARKHFAQLGHKLSALWIDAEYSSAPWFKGWREPIPPPPRPPPTADPETWLLKTGWWFRGGGLISRAEVPVTA